MPAMGLIGNPCEVVGRKFERSVRSGAKQFESASLSKACLSGRRIADPEECADNLDLEARSSPLSLMLSFASGAELA